MKMVTCIDLYITKGEGGLNREGGGLINFPPLKKGGLIREGGAYLRWGA